MFTREISKLALVIILVLISLTYVSAVRINEVMYHSKYSDYYNEYVEIYNDESIPLNLTGWKLCNNNLLTGYINRSKIALLNSTLILEPNSYALITDGDSGTEVYFNFNVSNNSLALHVDGAAMCTVGLNDTGENITLINGSGGLIDSLFYSSSWGANGDGKSLQWDNQTWQSCTPTPGQENLCQISCIQNWSCSAWNSCTNEVQTRSCADLNNCLNSTGKPAEDQPCNPNILNSSIYAELEWDDAEIINKKEFDIRISAYNLLDKRYDAKVYLRFKENDSVISETYDDAGESWYSSYDYLNNVLNKSGNQSRTFSIRLKKGYQNFSGIFILGIKIRDGNNKIIKYSGEQNIEVLEQEYITNESIVNEEETAIPEENITLLKLTSAPKDIKSYKSKSQYIKEYALYGFTPLLAIILIGLIAWQKKLKRGKRKSKQKI